MEEEKGLDVTIEEVIDYLDCPAKYDFRHNRRIDRRMNGYVRETANQFTMEENFDREFHKIAYHIFNYIQDEKYPSEYLLRKKWGDIWCEGKEIEDLLYEPIGPSTRNHAKRLERHGVNAISLIHPKFKKEPGIPMLVGKRAKVKVGRHTLGVLIDLVREVDGEIEIMDFKTGIQMKKKSDIHSLNLHVEHDLSVTAASLAFRQMTGMVEDKITYYDYINDREIGTRRGDRDFQILEHILNKMQAAMELQIYYPVMGERCYKCPFQKDCRDSVWMDDDKEVST